MAKKPKFLQPDEPLTRLEHSRPNSRREFLARGLMTGAATVVAPTLLSVFTNPRTAQAALANIPGCETGAVGAGKIPFICFDLVGGASIAGSNVLVGQAGGQLDALSGAGYSKLGLPGGMTPNSSTGNYIDTSLGLAFHSDSGFLFGIHDKISPGTAVGVNGIVIPARSENDTGNNPHNPMYGIARAGASGELLTLIGSVNSESGGNSLAPAAMLDPTLRPTKVDRPSDAFGLVDTGKLVGTLKQDEAVAVMETIYRISDRKLGRPGIDTRLATDRAIKDAVRCGYLKSADLVNRFGDPTALNPEIDPNIVGPNGIFTEAEFRSDSEFRKAASVMKLVIGGHAGAGTITMGGYDYHTGDRATGELRDIRAGRCIGACLEYAARLNKPLMIYVFSDGSVNSNGMIDDSINGRGKGVWTGDDQSTAASFILVYNPNGRPNLRYENRQQIGYFRPDGSVETASSPAANNVNLLVETVVLNYMALHGEENLYADYFRGISGLGSGAAVDRLIAFDSLGW